MLPNGAGRGQWQWMLKTSDITLYISRGLWNGIASVCLNSEFLWSRPTLAQALVDIHALLYEVFNQTILHLQPSSIDLCADIAGWEDVEKLNKKRSIFLHWLAANGQDHLEKKERDFALEVFKKRVKIGRQKLDAQTVLHVSHEGEYAKK